MKRILFALLLGLSAFSFAIAAAPLPPESVLQQSGSYTDQAGRSFHLADRRGHVQIVSMFYSSCTYTCPLMVDSALGVDHALKPAERAELRFLLVSFDPQRDTPAVLDALATKRHLDTSRYTLARADEDSVRKFANLLGVRYRKLADGDFNHTTGLILLDADGRVLAKTDHLGAVPDPAFLAAVKATLDQSMKTNAR